MVMMPRSDAKASCRTLASGARQLVVQEALEMMFVGSPGRTCPSLRR